MTSGPAADQMTGQTADLVAAAVRAAATSAAKDAVVRFFHDVDRQDWDALRAGLTDVVETDYTSLNGGSPAQLHAEDLLATWRGMLPGFDVTQHLLGPLAPATADTARTSPEERQLECNVRGVHRLTGAPGGGEEWLVAGRYAITVRRSGERWRIAAITLQVSYQAGNLTLPDLAASRAGDLA